MKFVVFIHLSLKLMCVYVCMSNKYVCGARKRKRVVSMESERCQVSETINAEVEHEKTICVVPQGNNLLCSLDLGVDQYEGFWYHNVHLEGVKWTQKRFKSKSSDILLSSAPKSGTTWLKALAFALLTRHQFDLSSNPLLSTLPHDCVPSLEMDIARNPSKQNPQLALFSTHIPHSSLPNSILSSGCKIVYICRDPKDAFVSYWHFFFQREMPHPSFLPIEDVFDMFCRGISYYGPYWDHVLGYWKASLERPDRVLFLTYEDMKTETSARVKRLAEFIGCPFSEEEEREGVVERVVNLCSFKSLSNLEVNKKGKYGSQRGLWSTTVLFSGKGRWEIGRII